MHILFLCHYFPPEVNAPASRTYENAKRWVRAGHQVTVVTCAPNHPAGTLYPGYTNPLWQWEVMDGIHVLRVWTYLSANKGVKRRILNYLSYLISATALSSKAGRVDVVVATSPQFFCALAGYLVARLKAVPWLLEIRDLWPASIVAVGALNNRKLIGLLETLESFLYRHADHIIALTWAFRRHIIARGVAVAKVSMIPNGADLDRFPSNSSGSGFRKQINVGNKFVAAYIGTHGMAHGLDTVLKAGRRLRHRNDIVLLLVGDGAERNRLVRQKRAMGLNNVILLPQQPKSRIPGILAAADACMVLLRDTPLFRTVIPSKIFEAMAMQRPIILGVRGESRQIVDGGRCGICIPPEDAAALAAAVTYLADHPVQARRLGENGRRQVVSVYNRDHLAERYGHCIEAVWRSEFTDRTNYPAMEGDHP